MTQPAHIPNPTQHPSAYQPAIYQQPVYQPAPTPVVRSWNIWSIISFGTGTVILAGIALTFLNWSFFPLGFALAACSILPIIFSIVSIIQIRRTRQKGLGLAISGIVFGLLGILALLALIVILFLFMGLWSLFV